MEARSRSILSRTMAEKSRLGPVERRAAPVLLVVAGLAVAPSAVADPAAERPKVMRLHYVRGAGAERACPDARGFRDAVAGQTPRELFADDAAARLDVTVGRRGKLYTGRAELRDAAGKVVWSREIAPLTSCDGLVEELAISIQIDLAPNAAAAPAPPPATVEHPAPAPQPAPPPIPVAPPPVAPRKLLELRLDALAAAQFATAPKPTVLLGADVGVRWWWLSATLGPRWAAPMGATVAGVQLTTDLLGGELGVCAHWDRAWLFACGELFLGRLHGVSAEVTHPSPGVTLYGGAGAGVGVEAPILRYLALRGAVDLLATFPPASFRAGSRVLDVPPVMASVGAGVVFRFGLGEHPTP